MRLRSVALFRWLGALACVASCACQWPSSTGANPPDPRGSGASPVGSSVGPFRYVVRIDDPRGALTYAQQSINACARGALDEWGNYLTGVGPLSVEIRIISTSTGRMAGSSSSNVPLGPCGPQPGCTVVEEQGIHRLRTGLNNPSMPDAPDVHIDIDPNYWITQVWVDPDIRTRTTPVPANRLDCVSLFAHEIGHALGMTGFKNLQTFQPIAPVQSLYDMHVQIGPTGLFFVGNATTPEYGPIPLTRTGSTQNIYHYGDATTPSALNTQLMNGIAFQYGRRYWVQRVDVRILQDLGVPVYRLPPN